MRRAVFALLALPLAAGCFHSQFRTKPRVAEVGGDPIVQMTSSEKLPTLDGPRLVRLKAHTDPPGPGDPIVGLELGGEGRAYPLGLLDRYEVVNDEAQDLDYVVARCPLTQIVAVYDRRVAGQTLTFVNSGALWRDTLVLKDRETGTLWTAATGEALFGPLAGERLRPVPALFSDSRDWNASCPDSRYLDTGDSTGRPLPLKLYSVSPWQGVSGARTLDERFAPKDVLFSVAEGSEAIAFEASDLRKLGRALATLADRPVVLEWDEGRAAPRAFRDGADGSEELAVMPIYWFALDLHFETVRTVDAAGHCVP
jgi:hypothetical protein